MELNIYVDTNDLLLERYREKLENYKEVIGVLPANKDGELGRILLNPTNEGEINFCISCFKFLKCKPQFFEIINANVKNNWEETLNMMLHRTWLSFEDKKKLYSKLLELGPELISKLSDWTKDELKKVLLTPTTEEEFWICERYLEFLEEQAYFITQKNRYLDRLEGRQTIVKQLTDDDSKKGLVEILLDPQSDKELEFCTSYFGFQDDIKFLSECAKEGKCKEINPEESKTVDNVAKVVKMLCRQTAHKGELNFLFDANPGSIADMLYELKILENSDLDTLMNIISNKCGYNYGKINLSSVPFSILPKYTNIYLAYRTVSEVIQNYLVRDIDRNNQNITREMDGFTEMTRKFHYLYSQEFYFSAPTVSANNEKSKIK